MVDLNDIDYDLIVNWFDSLLMTDTAMNIFQPPFNFL